MLYHLMQQMLVFQGLGRDLTKLLKCGETSHMRAEIEEDLHHQYLPSVRAVRWRTKRNRRIGWVVVAWLVNACLLMDLALAAVPAGKDTPFGGTEADFPIRQVSFQNGLLSVDVRQGLWVATLASIEDKTGILFHCVTPLEGTVTVSFKDLPVKTALEQLFGPGANFIFRYENAADGNVHSDRPAEVWVLGRVGRASTDTVAAGDSARQPQEAAYTKQAVGHNTSTPDNAPIQPADVHHLMEMANSSDPAIRLEALSSLAENDQIDQGVSRSVFDAALTDEDPNVRGLAVQTLASRGGAEALNYLRQGLRDPDPGVRIMAVQTAEPSGEGLALLQEALSDTDESVRAIAEFRLTHPGNSNTDH